MHGRVGRRAQEVLKGPLWGVGVHLLICFLGMCIVEVEDGARSRSRKKIVKAESFCTSSWAGWAVAIVMHTYPGYIRDTAKHPQDRKPGALSVILLLLHPRPSLIRDGRRRLIRKAHLMSATPRRS